MSQVRRRAAAGKQEAEETATELVERKSTGGSYGCVKWTTVTGLLIAAVIWCLPLPIDPIAYRFGEGSLRPFEGALKINTHLKKAKLLFPGELLQPESFLRDSEGYVYTGLGDGRLVRLLPDLSNYTTVLRVGQPPFHDCGTPAAEDHCGRVLGLHLHPSRPDLLYAADSSFGLLEINILSKEVNILVPQRQENEDTPFINFSNDLVVLENGSIFFTDSSKKFLRRDVILEVYEGRPNGQLLHYDPSLNRTRVVLDSLHLPNGLCLSHDNTTLLFAETSRARIMRYYLSGPKAGSSDVFIDNLPGLPDNVSPTSGGDGYWVPFALTRTAPALEYLLTEYPSLRSLIVKLHLARFIARIFPKHGLIIEVDTRGQITRSLHDEGGEVIESISHVLDVGDRLLLGSYEAPHGAVVSL